MINCHCPTNYKYKKLKNFLQFNIFLVLILTLITCKSTGAITNQKTENSIPSEFQNPQEIYPTNQYLSAVGIGNSVEDAQKSALNSIAQQIKVNIKSNETFQESIYQEEQYNQENQTSSNVNIKNSAESTIQTSTDLKLIGVKFDKIYVDANNLYYIIAYLDKLQFAKTYTQRIEDRQKEIDILVAQNTRTYNFTKFENIGKAWELSRINDMELDLLSSVSSSHAQILINKLENQTTNLYANMSSVASKIPLATETVVYGADTTDTRDLIESNIIDVFSKYGFNINANYSSIIPYIITSTINLKEELNVKYPTILWTFSFKIIDPTSGAVVRSFTDEGRNKGKDIQDAKKLSVFDVINNIKSNIIPTLLNKK